MRERRVELHDTSRRSDVSEEINSLARALTGAWIVAREVGSGSPRFRRIAFYSDARFGVRALDGRSTLYGHWQLRELERPARQSLPPPSDTPAARLTLAFDRNAGPSGLYRIRMADPPQGPMMWEDADAPGSLVALVRAGAIDAALVGTWLATSDSTQGVPQLELRGDGHYVMHAAGGVTRPGTWQFDRTRASPRGVANVEGVLRLDPIDAAFPVESWRAVLVDGSLLALENNAGSGSLRLRRRTLDSWSRQFAGVWRFAGPGVTPVPHEINLRANTALEVLVRAGAPRTHGRWSLDALQRHPDALEGRLTLELHAPGKPTVREHWRVRLSYGRDAELRIFSPDGKHTLRYRRLFR